MDQELTGVLSAHLWAALDTRGLLPCQSLPFETFCGLSGAFAGEDPRARTAPLDKALQHAVQIGVG
jgi:hypothetical protein